MNHRFMVVPLAIGEPERLAIWRCTGCRMEVQDPSEVVGDCTALALFDDPEPVA